MKFARVFPTKTSMSPTDIDCYFDVPDATTPFYDMVHISCTFSWDIPKAKMLYQAWQLKALNVKLGGVAIDGESTKPFVGGVYLKPGITITSRGCPNKCKFCFTGDKLLEFDNFPDGNIIQDNNILACSDRHWRLVMGMLLKQHAIEFKGGLDKYRLTDEKIEDLQSLRIKSIWIACDKKQDIGAMKTCVRRLHKAGFKQWKIFCFVLIGDDIVENENRLKEVYLAGAMPFAQLFKNKENSIQYSTQFKNLARCWSRPAIYKTIMKG